MTNVGKGVGPCLSEAHPRAQGREVSQTLHDKCVKGLVLEGKCRETREHPPAQPGLGSGSRELVEEGTLRSEQWFRGGRRQPSLQKSSRHGALEDGQALLLMLRGCRINMGIPEGVRATLPGEQGEEPGHPGQKETGTDGFWEKKTGRVRRA